MKSVDITIDLPEWLLDRLARAAEIAEKTKEQVALSFFAEKVVHT